MDNIFHHGIFGKIFILPVELLGNLMIYVNLPPGWKPEPSPRRTATVGVTTIRSTAVADPRQGAAGGVV